MSNQELFIFNIGFGRSGSTSLTKALNILNIKTLHFVSDNGINLETIVLKNIKRNKKLLYPLDEKYQGFSDFGGEQCYQTLYKQYPNSKFIFTIRPFRYWIESVIRDRRRCFPKKFITKNSIYNEFFYAINRYYDKSEEIQNFFKDKPD